MYMLAVMRIRSESDHHCAFQNLIEDLKSELGGKFEDLIVALMYPPTDYLCKQLHKAMKGLGTDESCLVEILCSHNNAEVQEIVEAYERCELLIDWVLVHLNRYKIFINSNASVYSRPLAEHMCSETTGDFRRLLTLIITVSNISFNTDIHDYKRQYRIVPSSAFLKPFKHKLAVRLASSTL